jgi:hypothetical protein
MATKQARFRRCANHRGQNLMATPRACTIRPVPSSARISRRLDIGPDVAAVLRPEEAARLHELRDLERLRCAVCGEWVEPASDASASVSIAIEDGVAIAQFAHSTCASSRADLAELAVLTAAEPRGIAYAQGLHPEAGAVLLWERKLDVRVRGLDRHEPCLYLDAGWWNGFHRALTDEPVRLLVGWGLANDGPDLVLRRDNEVVERFHGAGRTPSVWIDTLAETGFCLLIVGARLELELPAAGAIQRAIRAGNALMGLVAFEYG